MGYVEDCECVLEWGSFVLESRGSYNVSLMSLLHSLGLKNFFYLPIPFNPVERDRFNVAPPVNNKGNFETHIPTDLINRFGYQQESLACKGTKSKVLNCELGKPPAPPIHPPSSM